MQELSTVVRDIGRKADAGAYLAIGCGRDNIRRASREGAFGYRARALRNAKMPGVQISIR